MTKTTNTTEAATKSGMRVSVEKGVSAFGVVTAVEAAIRVREWAPADGTPAIYVIQALSYVTGVSGDPWSPQYPSPRAAAEKIKEFCGIEVDFVL